MPRSRYSSQRSEGIWPKALALSAAQVAIVLVIAVAVFVIYRGLDASGSASATTGDAPVSASADCPQLANTFDSQRAACLRRRWSAMRNLRPWRDASENALFEECLRSPDGEIAIPFKTNSCGHPKAPPGLQRVQN